MKTRPPRSRELTIEELLSLDDAQLEADLGFADLDDDAFEHELLAAVEGRRPGQTEEPGRAPSPGRVTQVGPGRRRASEKGTD